MDLLADENVETEWIRALDDDGHDIVRVVDVAALGARAPDQAVLNVATHQDRVLLTADQAEFRKPASDDHAGITLVPTVTRTGSEVRSAVRRIEHSVPDLSGHVVYVSDWL